MIRTYISIVLFGIMLPGCAYFHKGAVEEPVPVAEPDKTSSDRLSANAGELCGGIAGIVCADGLFCKLSDGACIDMADAAGTCIVQPQVCTLDYKPVCGCDGKTYSNACAARAAGISIASSGPCKN